MIKKLIDELLYMMCYPLRILDKHTAIFSKIYWANEDKKESNNEATNK